MNPLLHEYVSVALGKRSADLTTSPLVGAGKKGHWTPVTGRNEKNESKRAKDFGAKQDLQQTLCHDPAKENLATVKSINVVLCTPICSGMSHGAS